MDLSPTRTRLAALLGAGALALTACGGGGSAAPSSSSSAPAPASSSGAAASSPAADAAAASSASGPSISRSSVSADPSSSASSPASGSTTDAPSASAADGEAPALADSLDRIRANMKDADSVRINAENLPGSGAQSVEVAGAVDGSATRGVVTGSDADFSGTMEFIHVGGVTYLEMRGDGSGTDMDQMAEVLDGRWLKDTQGEIPVDEMTPRVILDGVDQAFDEATAADIAATRGEVVTQGGERLYRYTDASNWSMLVDEQDNLRAFTEEGGDRQQITFSDWNAVDAPTAPAASQVMTIEQLQKEAASSGPSSAGASASSSKNG